MFSNHAGAPTDRPILDTDPKLYEIQKAQRAPVDFMESVSRLLPILLAPGC